ncbi:TIGR03905 family TSCPD domain-containing protein [bacterium]|nr:TIGR03905 family TSCPD domain-containing protein [bacterium]
MINYETTGTCCKLIQLELENDTIKDVNFRGGCAGNLLGIRSLVRGKNINEVIDLLQGIPCGNKGTSCPDQLAKSLIAYKTKKEQLV